MKKKSLSVVKKTRNFYFTKLKKPLIKKAFEDFYDNLKSLDLKNKKIIIAVSGGVDSLSLLFFAKCISLINNTKLYPVIVDHKIRPGSTNEANDLKKKIKNSFFINCKILSKNKTKISKNIQSQARELRYNLILEECKKKEIEYIFLGHHRGDLEENFFIRFLRGSGLKGLVSLNNVISDYKNIKLIRPMLNFTKKKLYLINKQTFNYYVEDPTNFDDKFLRTRIRKLLLNLKEEGLNFNKFNSTMTNLSKTDRIIEYYVNQNILNNLKFLKGSKKIILNKNFFKNPQEVVFRSFAKAINLLGDKKNYPRGKKVVNLLNLLNSSNKASKFTLSGCLFEKINETVIIYQEK